MFKIEPHYAGNDLASFYNNRGCEFINERDYAAALNAFYKAYIMNPSNTFAKNNIKTFASVPESIASQYQDKNTQDPREMLGDYWFGTGAYLYALAEFEMLERDQLGGERILKKMWDSYREAKIDSPTLIQAHEQTNPRLVAIIKREKAAGNFKEPTIEEKDAFWVKLDRLAAKAQYEKVLEELTNYLRANPNDSRAVKRLARTYFHIGELEKAKAEVKKILEEDPKSYDAYELLGHIFMQERKFDESLTNLDNAVSINPDRDRAYQERANAFHGLKKEAEMKAEFAKAKEKASQFGRYYPDGEPAIAEGVYTALVYPVVMGAIHKQLEPQKVELKKLSPDKKVIVEVEISIDRKGTVSGQVLNKSCGDEQLDQTVLTAIKSISKAPPIPIGPTIELAYSLNLNPNYKRENADRQEKEASEKVNSNAD